MRVDVGFNCLQLKIADKCFRFKRFNLLVTYSFYIMENEINQIPDENKYNRIHYIIQ